MSFLDYRVLHRIAGRIRIRLYRIQFDEVFQDRLYAFLKSLPGVRRVRINASCSSVVIFFDETRFQPEESLAGLSEETVMLADLPLGLDRRSWLRKDPLYKLAGSLETAPGLQLGLGAASLLAAVLPFPRALCRLTLLLSSLPIFGRGIRTVLEERRPAVEFMDGASIIVLTLESAYLPAGIMLLLIGLGEYIRDFAARKSERIINELQSLSSRSAWLVRDESRLRVPAEKLKAGDSIVVYTGERIPVDAEIESGVGTIIKSGAPADLLPEELQPGDKVPADSILLEGKLYLKCGSARVAKAMDRMMEREQRRILYRTSYQRKALKMAYSVVAPILFFASGAFLVSRNLNQALTILCFDFVTGIRIALPTAILAYMYRAGAEGVLIKTGAALEQLCQIDVLVFARTGVLTAGESEVSELLPLSSCSPEHLLAAAASVEYRYHHPAARAIYRYAKSRKMKIEERKNSCLYAGLGVSAELEKRRVTVGSRRLMKQFNIDLSSAGEAETRIRERGDSLAYVAFDNELVGLIAYRDSVRKEAPEAIKRLKETGLREIVMTSGDAANSVERIAGAAGVERVFTHLSPEEKADLVRDFQLRGQKVAVIGDDVSDALAMAQADLAIAMNDSTDVARYRADIIITDDNLNHLPSVISLSKEAMTFSRQNMALVSLPNWLGLLLSITNLIGPVKGTVLNNGSVILAALNGLRPVMSYEKTAEKMPEELREKETNS